MLIWVSVAEIMASGNPLLCENISLLTDQKRRASKVLNNNSSASGPNKDGGNSFLTRSSFLAPMRPMPAAVKRYAASAGAP